GSAVQQVPITVDSATRIVVHLEHIRPGQTAPRGATLKNPYAGNSAAIATGAKLFISYNCLDCHGAEGSGAMGPSLADGRWHFGGDDSELFESIYQGRPDGMPAWGSAIAADQIWMLVSYVKSLNGGKDVTTENFSGKTIERTGH
ncbi:MAG TPA: c-type cytochrome, partial [Gemmatimonadaceae bacterium]|nr:c-type cytochrome [Gemmatimonadaceae bacterium]